MQKRHKVINESRCVQDITSRLLQYFKEFILIEERALSTQVRTSTSMIDITGLDRCLYIFGIS